MGAMFIGQQFLQNVLGYSTLDAGLRDHPGRGRDGGRRAAFGQARREHGARFTLLVGYVFCLLGFLTMLLLWKEDIAYWKVGLGYLFVGIGVGFAGTPASQSLTGSVPVSRAGMASGTADLQRDLGGAIMQSIFGALLTAGYAAAAHRRRRVGLDHQGSTNVQEELEKSFSSAAAGRPAEPALLQPDHRRRQDRVPAGRPVGLHGRHRRDPARRDARVVPLPDQGRGEPAARELPRTGHRRPRSRLTAVDSYLAALHDRLAGDDRGAVADYIPELAKADPSWFGIALATVDGAVYEAGDTRAGVHDPVDLQAADLRDGAGGVRRDGARADRRRADGRAVQRDRAPDRCNPMVNAGAILARSLLGDEPTPSVVDTYGAFAGRALSIDDRVRRSESETSDRNRAIAHLLRGAGRLEGDANEVVERYIEQCSVARRLPRPGGDRRDAGGRRDQPGDRLARGL